MLEPSKKLQVIFEKAIDIAQQLEHEYITIEHLTFSIILDPETYNSLAQAKFASEFIKVNLEHFLKTKLEDIRTGASTQKPKRTTSVERVLNRAFTQALFSGRQVIEVEDVLIAIIGERKSFSFYYMTKAGITKERLIEYFQSKFENEIELDEDRQPKLNTNQLDKILNQFCTNLSLLAKQRKIDPVIGRDDELEKIQLILARRSKCNVLLIGEPGVGKTAIAEGLARKIFEKKVPKFILDHQVYTLDISALLAGSSPSLSIKVK